MVRYDLNLFEVWKPIPGFPWYEVSSEGRVWSKRNGLLKTRLSDRGYVLVNLYNNGKLYTKKVHRLVAEVFLSNPNNLPYINHKDENKSNNNVLNIEFCDAKYNCNYGTRIQRQIDTKIKSGLYNPETAGVYLSKEERGRIYRNIHKEKIRNYQKQWKEEHKDYTKQYNKEYYAVFRKNGTLH